MTMFCHFDVELADANDAPQRVAVVFTPAVRLKPKEAAEELKVLFADAFIPRRTIFLGIKDAANDLKELLTSDHLQHVDLPFEPNEVELYVFSEEGRFVHATNFEKPWDPNEATTVRRQGMTTIFNRRGGLMRAGSSYHYAKPSGGHSRQFLRPGNIMKQGPEVSFLAVWLVPHITKYTPLIYADTASVTQVAYAAVALARRLQICKIEPSIQSFSSYEGIENTEKFYPEHEAVVLISASTSGNLRKRALDSGAEPKNVLTLFSTAQTAENCLCDLRRDPKHNPLGILPIQSYTKVNCPECAAGSLPITIAGDSFLPETPEPSLKLLKRTEKPKWLERTMKALEGKKAIGCFRPRGEGRDAPFFLDLSVLCKGPSFSENFELPLSRILSVKIDVIIHLPDRASAMIAQAALNEYKDINARQPEIYSSADRELDEKLAKRNDSGSPSLSVLVIASCISGGFSLLGVSRTLRNIANRISYFVGLAMPSSQQGWEEIKSNLEARNDKQGQNPVEIVWIAQMPRFSSGEISSWDLETRWLTQSEEQITSTSPLYHRSRLLKNVSRTRMHGLVDNAFLPSPAQSTLRLAENFVFHKPSNGAYLTQADVFFIVTSILHGLRDPAHPNGLRQSMNSHVLLSPANFDRYNDSVLQAALLRAAQPSELSYVTHTSASRSMADLIARMMRRAELADGEALPEFLLALATKRMSLTISDLLRLLDEFDKYLAASDYLRPFGAALKSLAGNVEERGDQEKQTPLLEEGAGRLG